MVLPLIWSFLLEPNSTVDPESENDLIDFKSIVSFVLVGKSVQEAFEACNGWLLCAQALGQEAEVKKELLDSFNI